MLIEALVLGCLVSKGLGVIGDAIVHIDVFLCGYNPYSRPILSAAIALIIEIYHPRIPSTSSPYKSVSSRILLNPLYPKTHLNHATYHLPPSCPDHGHRRRHRRPLAQSWQAAVDQALAEANAAIQSGTQQASAGAQSGIDTANAAIAAAGFGKRQTSWQQEVTTALGKRQSWQETVNAALANANAAIQDGIASADNAIGKRQSWRESVAAALAQAEAAVAQAQADGAAGVATAQAAVEEARRVAADAVERYGS